MPIDTSIALGVRPPQFQTIDPMTIYSAMENQRINALREQALQQDMQRNALIMQNTMEDRRAAAAQAALARRQQEEFKRMVQAGYQPPKTAVMGPGTIQGNTPASYDYEGVKNRLIGSGNLTGYEALSKAQEQEANRLKAQLAARNEGFTGNKIQAETQGLNLKNADTQLAQVASSIDRAPTMEAVYAIYSAVPDALAVRGQTPETAIQAFNAHVAELSKTMPPNEAFAQARRDVANGAMATQKQLSEIATAQKPEIREGAGGRMYAVNPYTAEAKSITEGGAPVMAKPSAQQEKAAIQTKQMQSSIDTAITTLEDLIKPNSLIDDSTASGGGALIDTAAGFFGYATPGSVAASKLKVLADPILKMVPRFEGPQSDKDTQSYKEAAGELGNEYLPAARRKAAAETILKLFKKRRDQFTSADLPEAVPGASTTANPFQGFKVEKIGD